MTYTSDDLKRGRQISTSRIWIGAGGSMHENIAHAIAQALAEGRAQAYANVKSFVNTQG
jgi:hypothetical protein